MKKFKRFVVVIMAVLLTAVGVAGCALFERDAATYNNTVVARIGGDITITKKELIDAYASFGYNYVTENSYTLDKAYDETLNALIQREILAKSAALKYGFGGEVYSAEHAPSYGNVFYENAKGEKQIAVTYDEAKSARQSSFTAMKTSLAEMETRSRESMNMPDNTPEAPAESTATENTYTPYTKFMIKDPITFTVKKEGVTPAATQTITSKHRLNLDAYKDAVNEYVPTNKEFIESLKTGRSLDGASVFEVTVANDAYRRLVRLLKENEKGLNYKGDEATDEACLMRELVRMQKSEEKNLLTRRTQEVFEHGITNAADYETMTNLRKSNFGAYEDFIASLNYKYLDEIDGDAARDYYRNVKTAIDRYTRKYDTEDSFYAKMLGDLAGVYFVPETVANQFFTVSHILVKYTDAQTAELTKINDRYDQGFITAAERDTLIKTLQSKVTKTAQIPTADGKTTETTMTAENVLSYVQGQVDGLPLQEKVEKFRDLIYIFNDDPGMINAEFEYVIGREDKSRNTTNEDGTPKDGMSQMVPEFTAAARELFNYDVAANRGGVKEVNGHTVDLRGSMSEIVWTTNGAHILMYTRNISDFIWTISSADSLKSSYNKYINAYASLADNNFEKLLYATRTSYGNKSTFDVLVEGITKPAYADYEKNILADYRETHPVKIYTHAYENLRKGR